MRAYGREEKNNKLCHDGDVAAAVAVACTADLFCETMRIPIKCYATSSFNFSVYLLQYFDNLGTYYAYYSKSFSMINTWKFTNSHSMVGGCQSEQYFPLKWLIFTRRNNLYAQKISISSGARVKFYHRFSSNLYPSLASNEFFILNSELTISRAISNTPCSKFSFNILARCLASL